MATEQPSLKQRVLILEAVVRDLLDVIDEVVDSLDEIRQDNSYGTGGGSTRTARRLLEKLED